MVEDESLFQVVERLSQQASNTLAALDGIRAEGSVLPAQLTYSQLHEAACRISAGLAGRVEAGQLLGTQLPRGNDWYATFLGAARLQVSTVGLSTDLPDKELEAMRNAQIVRELQPALLVINAFGSPHGVDAVTFSRLWAEAASKEVPTYIGSRNAQLCFQYTGGSTGACRCAIATHKMALWEVSMYPAVAKLESTDRVLQQHSIYWAASAVGEVDIALAFGCALVFCEAFHTEQLTAAIRAHAISCAGIVPSVLDSMEPSEFPSLKLVFTWGEALQPRAARRWAKQVRLIDLLISTESWLSLYADWSANFPVPGGRPPFCALPGTGVRLLPPEGQTESPRVEPAPASGELVLAGPMVSPGYTDQAHNASSFLEESDGRWYRTRDCLERCPCGGFVYTGRSNELMKIGGVWVDSREVVQRLDSVEGVVASCVFNGVAYVQLDSMMRGAMRALRRALPLSINLFVVPMLPRHPATGKIDRTKLERLVGIRRDHAPSSPQGILANFYTWWLLLAGLFICRLATMLEWEMGTEQRLLQTAFVLLEVVIRVFCLSYMMLLRLHHDRVKKYVGYLPLGGPTELAIAAALLPLSLLACSALPGVFLAWWRARLISWPVVCAVGFPLWAQSGSAWFRSAGYKNVLRWYWSKSKYLPRRVKTMIKDLPSLAKSLMMCYKRFCKTCNTCKKECFYTDGSCDILLDPDWHCKDCWEVYHQHWQCCRCEEWAARGREEKSLAGWVCLRCAADLDAKKRLAVMASETGLEASGPGNEPTTKRAKITHTSPSTTPSSTNVFTLGGSRVPQSKATAHASPAMTSPAEKTPQWRLVEKALGLPFATEEEELLGIDSLRLTKLRSVLLREEGKQLSMDSLRRCKTLKNLLQEIDTAAPVQQNTLPASSDGGILKFLCQSRKRDELPAWGMMWNSKCLWTVHHVGPIDTAVLQQAVGELLRRHVALRSEPVDPMPLFAAVQETLSVLTLLRHDRDNRQAGPLMQCFFAVVSWSLKNAWPRVRATQPVVSKVLKFLDKRSSRKEAEALLRSARNAERFKPPFELLVAPYDGGLVLQICVTHMLSDGFCIVPLMADLASLVAAAEQGSCSNQVPAPLPLLEHPLKLLFPRIEQTISGDSSMADSVTPQRLGLDESLGSQDAISLKAAMPPVLVEDVRRAAEILTVTDEVVMLAALGVAMAKLDQKVCVSIQMVVPQRDAPGASDMVGMFSDYRCLDIFTGGLSYAGVALSLHHTVKERLWRPPLPTGQFELPFVNFEWTDFEERQGFSQIVDGGRNDTSVSTPMKLVVDQPDSRSWRVVATFKSSLYKDAAQKRFFLLLDEALGNLIDDPLKMVWP